MAPLDPRMRQLADHIDRRIKAEVARVMSQPQLAYSSIEDGAIEANDAEGNRKLHIGKDEATGEFVVRGENGGTVTADNTTDDYIYAGDIPVDQLTSGILNALMQTAAEGARIRLSDAYGFQAIGDDEDNTLMHVPTDGSAIQIVADIVARSLTARGQVALRGTGNEIAAGADMVLSAGTTPPVTPLSLSVDWSRTDWFAPPEGSVQCGGLAYAGGLWWRTVNVLDGWPDDRLESIDDSGTVQSTVNLAAAGAQNPVGVTVIGETLYVLSRPDTPWGTRRMVWAFDLDGTPVGAGWVYNEEPKSTYRPTIGTDGTDLLIAQTNQYRNTYFYRLDPDTGVRLEVVGLGDTGMRDLSYVGRGVFDFGSERIVVAAANSPTTRTFDSATGAPAGSDWSAPESSPRAGMAWHDGAFWALSADGTSLWKHSTLVDPQPLEFAATWRGGGSETTVGPSSRITAPARTGVKVSAPPIPDAGSADGVNVYAGNTITYDLWLQRELPTGKTTALFDGFVFSGTAAPATSTFPDSDPAMFWTRRGGFELDGTGGGAWPKKMQCGVETVTVGASTSPADKSVVFPVPFDAAPRVVVQQSQGGPSFYLAAVSGISSTGCTLTAQKTGNSGSGTVLVSWIAMAID